MAEENLKIGSGLIPVFVDKHGKVVPTTNTLGSGTKPIYLNNGTLTASNTTSGSDTKPLKMVNGSLVPVGSDLATQAWVNALSFGMWAGTTILSTSLHPRTVDSAISAGRAAYRRITTSGSDDVDRNVKMLVYTVQNDCILCVLADSDMSSTGATCLDVYLVRNDNSTLLICRNIELFSGYDNRIPIIIPCKKGTKIGFVLNTVKFTATYSSESIAKIDRTPIDWDKLEIAPDTKSTSPVVYELRTSK